MSPVRLALPEIKNMDFFVQLFEKHIIEQDITYSTESFPGDAWEWVTDEEAEILYNYIHYFGILLDVNDGVGEWAKYENNPYQRVLKFLKYVHHCYTEMI